MKVSESWLREWVSPELSTEELVAQVTMAGLEVDAVEAVAGEFTKVVVGEIVAIEQHPDAEKLRICQVRGGDEELTQVVCGAPNAREGLKAPFALVGAKLPGGLKIKKAKLRGVESFGMLCGQTELEAGEDDSGLWELPTNAPVGEDLRKYMHLDDKIIEMDLTPNRSDCLSVRGVARELGVLCRKDVTEPSIEAVPPAIDDVYAVDLQAGTACPVYVGRVIRNVDISKPSPTWLQEKLRRSGVRSIDPVVDVTNYVLLELGQPLHAFDLAKLQGGIRVRLADQGEQIALLNDQEIKLNDNTLVIADDSGAIAMAGVMGGSSTAVSETTKDIFLESAFFDPIAIAGRARSYGLHTDSSHRFERGVDYQLQADAIERATALLLNIVGGEAGPAIRTCLESEMPEQKNVELNKSRLDASLGLELASEEVAEILQRLGLKQLSSNDGLWQFEVPSYRFDIAIDADLTEEVARIYGYDRLPSRLPIIPTDLGSDTETAITLSSVRRHLVARDFDETINYSFIDPTLHKVFSSEEAVELRNPISADMSVMRTSLVPGLVKTLLANINRQQSRVRIFESGLRFLPAEQGYPQSPALAGLILGARQNVGWSADNAAVDFYDLKGDVESLIGLSRSPGAYEFEAGVADVTFLHPGQSASILKAGERVGYMGALHPSLAKSLGISKSVFVFELDLDALLGAEVPKYTPISRQPEVSRDLAIVVDNSVAMTKIESSIKDAAGESLKRLTLFDVYTGEGIDSDRKSLAFSLTFQDPSRTLTEEEINSAMTSIVDRLKEDHGANLR